MEAVAMLIAIFIVMACNGVKSNSQKKNTWETMVKNGVTRPDASEVLIDELYFAARRDWREERKLYPPEYIAYMVAKDGRMLIIDGPVDLWAKAWVNTELVKRGYRPWGAYCYDVCDMTTYDFYEEWYSRYGERADLYNRTGKPV